MRGVLPRAPWLKALGLQDHFDAFFLAGGHYFALAHVIFDDLTPKLVGIVRKPGASDQLDALVDRVIDDVAGSGLDEVGAGLRLLSVAREVALGVDEDYSVAIALDDDPVRFQTHRTLVDLHGTRGDHPLGWGAPGRASSKGCAIGRRAREPAAGQIAFHIVGAEVYRLFGVGRQGARLSRQRSQQQPGPQESAPRNRPRSRQRIRFRRCGSTTMWTRRPGPDSSFIHPRSMSASNPAAVVLLPEVSIITA